MSALTLSLFLLAVAGGVLALGAVRREPRALPVRAARRSPGR